MKNRFTRGITAAAVIAVLVLAGLARAEGDEPQIKQKEGIGKYLADGRGMTLYFFTKDRKDKNSCTGTCLDKWPIYYRNQIKAPRGSDAREFGEFTRADGRKQTTFKSWPLYYFVGDKTPGDTKGQGVNEMWYTINPKKIVTCD